MTRQYVQVFIFMCVCAAVLMPQPLCVRILLTVIEAHEYKLKQMCVVSNICAPTVTEHLSGKLRPCGKYLQISISIQFQ